MTDEPSGPWLFGNSLSSWAEVVVGESGWGLAPVHSYSKIRPIGRQTLALRHLVLPTKLVAAFLLPKALEFLQHMRYNLAILIL